MVSCLSVVRDQAKSVRTAWSVLTLVKVVCCSLAIRKDLAPIPTRFRQAFRSWCGFVVEIYTAIHVITAL